MPAETFSSSIDELAEREAREWESQQAQRALSVVADEPEPPRPRLVPVVLDGFMERPAKPPRYAIGGLVPRRHVTLLSAHGGSGKSMLALVWSAHVACGQSWAGLSVCGPAKAVFVSLEDEAVLVVDRLRRIVDEYGLNPGMVARNVVVFDGTDGDGALVVEMPGRRLTPTRAMAEVEAAARDSSLVTIDNGSDAFDGDEINRRQVRAFVRHLAGIARDADAGLILLAHIDKASAKYGGEGNTYSGSTAWHNSARSRIALVETDGFLELRQEKLNLGKRREPIALKFTDHGVLVPGKMDPAAVSAESDLVAQADARALLDVLWVAERAGIHVPTATSGSATAWHALEPLPELGKVYRAKDGRRRFNAALVKLARDGQIVRKTFMGPNRHPRERWELAQSATEGL
jgi:hypothetical protein